MRPAFVRAKLRDVAVLGALAALVLAVFLLSLAAQIAVQAGVDLSAALGLGDAADAIARAADLTVIGAATFAALVLVYRLGAPAKLAFTDVWRVALVAAVAIDVGLAGYAFYLVNDRRPRHASTGHWVRCSRCWRCCTRRRRSCSSAPSCWPHPKRMMRGARRASAGCAP